MLVVALGFVAVMRGWIPLGQPSSTNGSPAPSPSAETTPSEAASDRPTARTGPTATNTPVAAGPGQQLREQRSSDIASLALNGRWIAQLSSKYEGVTDSTQVAANGTNTFYLDDILIEHQALRARFASPGARVYLLEATDFGKQRNWPGTLWVTIADPGLGSQSAVQQWCQAQFPHLSGKPLENVCMARQLNPPSR